MTSAETAKKANNLPENSLDKKNQNLEEKDLVKELNKNSNRSPTKEQKKIHLGETSIGKQKQMEKENKRRLQGEEI